MNQHWQWWVQVTCCSEKGGACKYAILTGTCSPSRNNHHVCLQLLRWSLAALQGKRFTGLWVGRGLRTGSSVMQGEQLLEPFPPVATRAVAGLRGRRKNLHAAQAATGDQLSSPFPCLWGACPLLNWWGPSPVQRQNSTPLLASLALQLNFFFFCHLCFQWGQEVAGEDPLRCKRRTIFSEGVVWGGGMNKAVWCTMLC